MATPVFAGLGHFSYINVRLREALQTQLGPMSWCDAHCALDTPSGLVSGLPAAVARRPEFILAPRRLNQARVKTTPGFDLMSRAVRRHACGANAPYVVQTQGLFDGHLDGRPHFVYTDYTERANLRANGQHRLMPARWLRRELKLYESADLIFAASSTTRLSLIEDYAVPPDKVVLTHTGVNVELPRQIPERSRDAFEIVFVGTDWERKGGPDLIRAFARVRSRVPGATLTVVGCSPARRPPDGVRYVGRIAPERLPAYLESASVFCLPAHHEPAGIAYSEASAWGLPVVATTVGDIGDRILHGKTGLLVAPGDVEALADALLRLALDPALRDRLGRAGHAYTLAHFTWRGIAAKMAAAMRPRLSPSARSAQSPRMPIGAG